MNTKFKWGMLFILSATLGVQAQYTPPSSISSLLDKLRSYSNLTSVAGSNTETYAANITTWQLPCGGWFKAFESKYTSPWNGSDPLSDQFNNGEAVGTFDNNATVSEIRFLANQYKVSSNSANKAKFKTAVSKAIQYILNAQQTKGSWPQMYPPRVGTTYSNMATYNDNAMIRIMVLVQDMVNQKAPFDTDLTTATQRTSLSAALSKGVDYALKAQIVNGGKKTVWCQQHDPITFAPVAARAYELPSKSGSESAPIAYFLMNWPDQNAEVQAAVHGAIDWYTANRTPDLKWVAPDFVYSAGASLWYRYYLVDSDTHFFSDRDGGTYYDITQVSDERRSGYQWGGDYGSTLLKVAKDYNPPVVGTSSSSSTLPSSSSIALPTIDLKLAGIDRCAGEGVSETSNSGFEQSAYLNLVNATGSTAQYVLNAGNATASQMVVRFANGGTAGRTMSVNVNGTSVGTFNFNTNSSWTTWQYEILPLHLVSGRNEVKMVSTTADGGPNIDWIGFTGSELTTTDCTPTQNTITLQNSAPQIRLQGQVLMITSMQANTSVSLYSLTGQNLLRLSLNPHWGSTNYDLQSLGLQPGLYLVSMELANHSTYTQLIRIQH